MSTAARVRFLTGRCNVSKTNNKSGKVSPDLDTPTDLAPAAVEKISASLNTLLADAFALYLKTKNFHWHVSGRHFRDYHLLLDEQSEAIFATTDQIAERVRKLGGITPRAIRRRAGSALPSLRPAAAASRTFPSRPGRFCDRLALAASNRSGSPEAFAAIQRRREMPISFSMIVLNSQLVVAVADGVPNF